MSGKLFCGVTVNQRLESEDGFTSLIITEDHLIELMIDSDTYRVYVRDWILPFLPFIFWYQLLNV